MDQSAGLFAAADGPFAIEFMAQAAVPSWVRPILLTACSADGDDVVQVDARRWFERAARENPYAIRDLCQCWFTVTSGDPAEEAMALLLRTLDTDTSLFLVRRKLSNSGWTCNVDRAAVSSWITATQPNLVAFLDPLMGD